MKPYGRLKTVKFHCKRDNHPPKGWINWWEDMAECLPRTSIKGLVKKQIDDEISE